MKIKQYIAEPQGRQPGTPSTGAYEEQIGHAAAAMNQIGRVLGQAIDTGLEITKKFKEASRENQVKEMTISTEKEWQEFEAGFDRSDPDPTTYAATKQKAWDEIVKKISGITKDSETRRMFQEYADRTKLRRMPQLYNEQEKRFHNQYFTESLRNVDEWANLASTAESLEDAEIFKADMIAEINKGYPFSDTVFAKSLEDQKLKEIEVNRAKNAEGRVFQDILRDPGGTSQKLMLPPEAGFYPDIKDSAKRETLRGHAETIFKTRQTEVKQEADRIFKENHDAEEMQIGGLYATGKLKIDDIQKATFLSGDERYAWTARIEARQKAGVAKTDFNTYLGIHDAIYSGELKLEINKRITGAVDKGLLTENDAESLLNKSTAFTNSIEDHNTKKGYEIIKNSILGKPDKLQALIKSAQGEISVTYNEDDLKNYFKATGQLDEEMRLARQHGKPMTSDQVVERAFAISKSYKKKGVEDFLPGKEEIEKIKKSKKPVSKKEKGETLAEYDKRTGGM